MKGDPWTKVFKSVCEDTRLSDRDLRVYIAVKLRTRETGECYETVENIGKRAGGKKVKSVQRSLANLKRHGYLAETPDANLKTRRRLFPLPIRTKDASDLTDQGVKSDAPTTSNLTPNIEELKKNNDRDTSPACTVLQSTLLTNLSGEEVEGRELNEIDMLDALKAKVARIVEVGGGDDKALCERLITGAAKWLIETLMDDPKYRPRYCKYLRKLARGLSEPSSPIRAFADVYVDTVANRIGVMGSAFFNSWDYHDGKAITAEEMIEGNANLPETAQ